MMNLNKLYAMEVEGNVTYYTSKENRAVAYNNLMLKKIWLSDKVKKWEVNINTIIFLLDDGTAVTGKDVK